jgi:hypothetical protein
MISKCHAHTSMPLHRQRARPLDQPSTGRSDPQLRSCMLDQLRLERGGVPSAEVCYSVLVYVQTKTASVRQTRAMHVL